MLFPLSVSATDTCPAGYQPAEYVELEYIESTGTQYIDTGYAPTDLTDIELKASTLNSTGSQYLYGVASSPRYLVAQQKSGNLLNLDLYSEGYRKASDIITSNNSHIIQVADKEFIIDNVSYGVSLGSSNGNKANAYLFWANGASQKSTNLRIYYCKVFEQKRFIQYFIPVRRLSDGAVGMFDRVEGKFYGNNGTGEFIAGPEIEGSQRVITDENGDIVCVSCPANTYKPNAGNTQCTECPEHTFSPIGSTQLSDCAKILHVGEYVVYMPLGKRTEHGLCVMVDGKKYCADVYERQ